MQWALLTERSRPGQGPTGTCYVPLRRRPRILCRGWRVLSHTLTAKGCPKADIFETSILKAGLNSGLLSSSASFSIGCGYECLMHSKTFSIALEQTMTQISPRAVCSLPSEWHASLMEANSKIKIQERNIIKSKCATGRVTENPRPRNITVAKLLSKHISHQEKLHILKI